MRLVGYLRVSSLKQLDGWGLERQERAIRTFARTHDHRLVALEADRAISGTVEALDRPGLSAAIERIRAHAGRRRTADGLIVAHLDRLARSLTVQEAALAVIWQAEGVVFTPEGEVLRNDPDDPARTLIRHVMGAVIEYEKAQAVKRMRDGRLAKAATGRKSVGAYPYGYRGHGSGRERDATPEPAEQAVIELIVSLRAQGASYRTIVAALETAGHAPRHGRRWHPKVIRDITERHQSGHTPAPKDTSQ